MNQSTESYRQFQLAVLPVSNSDIAVNKVVHGNRPKVSEDEYFVDVLNDLDLGETINKKKSIYKTK